jgi:lipopolysaccharide transport system permease protein
MIQDAAIIWKFRYFWLSLVKMDLMTRYRKSVLGIFWSLLSPLAMAGVYCLVFTKLLGGDWDSYAKYLVAGMAGFGFLRDCTLGGCHSLTRHEGYIRQTPLPFTVYSLRVMLSNTFHFLVTLVVVVALVAVLPTVRLNDKGEPDKASVTPREVAVQGPEAAPADAPPPPTLGEYLSRGDWAVFGRVWQVLPALVLVMVCGWALATVTGFATVYFHDIAHLLELFAQFLFFLTPVMWYRHKVVSPEHGWLVDYNPAAAFMELFRKPLVYDQLPTVSEYTVAVGFTVGVVLLAGVMVSRLSKRVIFQM